MISKVQSRFVVYEKKMEEKRAIHRQEVYFQSIAQIATWTLAPILMVAHTSTITTLPTSSIGHYTFRIPFNGIYHIVQRYRLVLPSWAIRPNKVRLWFWYTPRYNSIASSFFVMIIRDAGMWGFVPIGRTWFSSIKNKGSQKFWVCGW